MERIPALVLDASGHTASKLVAFDTITQGILRVGRNHTLPESWERYLWAKKLNGYLRGPYASLSYIRDWRSAICKSRRLDAKVCNINNLFEYRACRRALREWPLVIALHSTTGDSVALLKRTQRWFDSRRGKLVVFVGNEYNDMDKKIQLLKATDADFICTQLPMKSAHWLYADCHSSSLVAMPHALNPDVYRPLPDPHRKRDIGFIGELYDLAIGDKERTNFIKYMESHATDLGLTCDIRSERMAQPDWARFLAESHGTLGAESGSYYLDRTGKLFQQARRYEESHPDTPFEAIFQRFFENPSVECVSGKCISSRHFEPAGTRTCQLLLEGDYNGILQADKHYIPVKKDLSNIAEAVAKFTDQCTRRQMVRETYDYVMASHTHEHRVQKLLETVIS